MEQPNFDGPIAGMGLTHELGARPWQQPAQYSTVDEAMKFYDPAKGKYVRRKRNNRMGFHGRRRSCFYKKNNRTYTHLLHKATN